MALAHQINLDSNLANKEIIKHKQTKGVSLIWNRRGNLQSEEQVFIAAFYDTYKNIKDNNLEVEDVYSYLQKVFEKERRAFKRNIQFVQWVTAVNLEGTVVGYASFDYDAINKEVYVRQLAVHPDHSRQGIGSKILNAARMRHPDAERMVINTRKINTGAFNFYKSLGFTNTDNIHSGYDSRLFKGMEIELTPIK